MVVVCNRTMNDIDCLSDTAVKWLEELRHQVNQEPLITESSHYNVFFNKSCEHFYSNPNTVQTKSL